MKVKELTINIIDNTIIENSTLNFDGIFQFLGFDKIVVSNNQHNSVILSDGFYSRQFLLSADMYKAISENTSKYNLLRCQVSYHAQMTVQFLLSFSKIEQNIDYLIGDPIAIDWCQLITKKNLHGNNQIERPRQNIDQFIQSFKQTQQLNNQNNQNLQRSQIFYNKIENLTRYDTSFLIRGRVVKKSELKQFKKKENEAGFVFSIVIVDETKDIQGVFFNESALQYYDKIKEGNVYSFKDGRIKEKQKYNNTSNNIQIEFFQKTEILSLRDENIFPKQSYNLVKFKDLKRQDQNFQFDVICCIEDPGEIENKQMKDGSQKQLRRITLKDEDCMILLNCWEEQAVKFETKKDSIVIFTNLYQKEYNGLTLNCTQNTELIHNLPDIPRFIQIYASLNKSKNSDLKQENLSRSNELSYEMKFVNIDQVQKQTEIMDKDNLYFTIFANLVRIPEKLFYLSCPQNDCRKKVEEENGGYRCLKCDKVYDTMKPRLLGNFKFSDGENVLFLLVANEEASKQIFEKTEDELYQMQKENSSLFDAFVNSKNFNYFKIKLRASQKEYNNNLSVRYTAVQIKRVEYSAGFYGRVLLKEIKKRI